MACRRASTRHGSSSRSAICCGVRTPATEAASSIASGNPSRRRQISQIAAALPDVSVNDDSTDRAACTNSATEAIIGKSTGIRGTPAGMASGTGSGGTRTTVSPRTARGICVVATTCNAGHASSSPCAMRRQPSITCSQLSRSRNKWRDWTAAAARMRKSPGPASSAPIASAISRSTLAASSTIARSTMTLARKSISTRRANSRASCVFPTPPGPVSVRSRVCFRWAVNSASSPSRPISDTIRAGNTLGRSGESRIESGGRTGATNRYPTTVHRFNELWSAGVVVEGMTQLEHSLRQRMGRDVNVLPDRVQQRLPRHDLAGMVNQTDQQVVRARLERQPFASSLNAAGTHVERDVSKFEARALERRRFLVRHG